MYSKKHADGYDGHKSLTASERGGERSLPISHYAHASAYAAIFALLLMLAVPCAGAAGEHTVGSTPALSGYVSGTNYFYPQSNVQITIVLENAALDKSAIRGVQYTTDVIESTTALNTIGRLTPGDAPVTVKTERQMFGNIPAGSSATESYQININENAPAGLYNLILETEYSYVKYSNILPNGMWDYTYQTVVVPVEIPIEIRGVVKPEILSVDAESISPGLNGKITLVIKNAGYETGTNAAALLTSQGGIIRYIDGSVFIGDFKPGDVTEVVFNAEVKDGAGIGVHPEKLTIQYTDKYGQTVTSTSESFGIPVTNGVKFAVTSGSIKIAPGESGKYDIVLKNIGDNTAYDTKIRLIPESEVKIDDNSASVGKLAPGESVTLPFNIAIDSSADAIPYSINTEIKYRDASDRLILAKQIKIEVDTQPPNVLLNLITNPITIFVIIGAILVAVYYTRQRKNE